MKNLFTLLMLALCFSLVACEEKKVEEVPTDEAVSDTPTIDEVKEVTDEVKEVTDEVKEDVQEGAAEIKEGAEDVADDVEKKVDEVEGDVKEAAESQPGK